MRKILILLISVTIVSIGFAQYPYGKYRRNIKYKVSGQIKDKETKKPVPYCPVIILNQKDSTVAFSLTNDKGYFTIPVKPGKYKMALRFMGYQPDTLPLEITNSDKIVGILKLKPQTNKLKTVVVKKATVKNLVDKDEIMVTEKLKTGAATATDVLDRINGISYDRYDDHIEVDNNEAVLFMVNGLEKDENYIKNMNPERIKKVEIIRDPGGRYGLEGYSAIINVVLKENYVGHEVNVSSMASIDTDTKDYDYLVPMKGGRLTYNFSAKKVNAYVQFFGFDLNAGMLTTTTKNMDSIRIVQSPEKKGEYNSVFVREMTRAVAGVDYKINPIHQLSIETSAGYTPPNNVFENYKENYFLNDTDFYTSDLYLHNTYSYSNNFGTKIFYLGNYSEKSSLRSDLRFSTSKNYSETSIKYIPPESEQTTKVNSGNKSAEYNIDWSYMLLPKWGFQIGYGAVAREMNSTTTYSLYPNTEKNSDYLDIRNRMFFYNTWLVNDKITIKGGLAYELSTPKVDNTTYSFSILQPYIDAQYKFSDFFNVKLKYRTKSIYPSVNQVNPNTIYIDAQRIQRGNPNIRPTAIHKISLKFNLLGGLMFFEPYYNFSDGYIASIITKDPETGKILYTYDNVGLYEDKGIKTSFTIPLGKKIMWRNNVKIFNAHMSYQDYDNKFTDWGGNSNLMFMDRKHNMLAGLMYQRKMFKRINLQGYSMSRNNWWGIMIQKSFFKKKLNIMAFYMLPIDFLIDYNRISYSQTEFYTQESISDASAIKNIFFMRLSYNFSKGKVIKKKTGQGPGNEDFQIF